MSAISPAGTHLDSMEGEERGQQVTRQHARATSSSQLQSTMAICRAPFTHLAAGKAGAFPPLFGGIFEDREQGSVGGERSRV